MRIISGEKGGRIITPPKIFVDRPTTDLAKESLFNILANRVDFEEITVLDLFAGTGSIGYEFASRGCKTVTAIEINFKYVDFINKTYKDIFGDSKKYFAIRTDALKFVTKNHLNYDIIFADPPFELENLAQIPDMIFANPNIKEDILVIIEHSVAQNFTEHPCFMENRKYGKVNFTFFKKKNETL